MSEQKRATLTTKSTVNSEKKSDLSTRKTVRLFITLPEPNDDSCPVFDYTKLCRSEEKKQLLKKQKRREPNGAILHTSSSDEDDDVRRLAQQFEEKYGKGNEKRQSRCQTYSELGAGYDENDSFIDNTDAYDEALPEELQTSCGGYYINSGRLEFKRVEMSDQSDIEEIIARRRKREAKVIDEASEDEEGEAEDENEGEVSGKVEEETKKEDSIPTVPKKVKISEDKPVVQAVVNVKDKQATTNTLDLSDAESIKAKKRKAHMQSMMEDTPAMKQKKKSLTVKALLEEKRVFSEQPATEESKKVIAPAASSSSYTSVNDVIESVIRGNDDSNSSSGLSKSNSGSVPTSETDDSQECKPTSNSLPTTPLPESLPPDIMEVVYRIKHLAATSSVLTRKVLSEDINNSLVSLELKSKDLPSSLRQALYSQLSCYLPCTKDTLMKRTRKLIVQKEEEKMKEPMKKLKAAVDAVMPVLLERYNTECQILTDEKGLDESKNTTNKVARRKFPWNDELRAYLRELITIQLQCYNVLKIRKETSEAFVTKFLNTQVRTLWPVGWMKTSTLLRESRATSFVGKPKKHSSNGIEPSSKNSNSNPRLSQLLLPSSTTLTPTNGTAHTPYSKSEANSYKQPSVTSTLTTTPVATKPGIMESNNLLSKMTSLSSSISPPNKKSHSPGNSVTISPVKKESFSVDALLKKNIEGHSSELNDSVSVITVNGTPMPFKDLPIAKMKKEGGSNSGDKILDLSNCMSKHHSVIQNPLSDRTAMNGESVSLSLEDNKHVVNSSLPSSKPKEDILLPPSAAKCIKSPPPYITSQEAERRLNEETATATDILSQIINESLLSNAPLQHQRSYEEEIAEERKTKSRTLSGEQDVKVKQEVDQVIQDLVELRQMSGGNTDNTMENSKSNYSSNPLSLHHVKSHDSEETSKHSPYGGFQDEFFKHLLKKETQLPTITKPTALPRHSLGPFDKSSPYAEDIPTKPSLYNSLPHRPNQSIPHTIIPPSSKPVQMNHANTSSLSLPTGSSESSPPH